MASISTIGAEWKRYYADPSAWPDGAYHEDLVVHVNGKHDNDADLSTVDDDATIMIECGIVISPDGTDADVLEHYQKWSAPQTTASGAFTAPKDKIEAVKAAIIAAGGSVIGGERQLLVL